MKHSKADAIRIVVNAAKAYKNELVNRKLLFVCTDKHKRVTSFEAAFYPRNFRHLTGLETDESIISANRFYELCSDEKLGISEKDIEFRKDGFTDDKLMILPYIMNKNLGSPNMLGVYSGNRLDLISDRFVGKDKYCVGFFSDAVTGNYVPNTLMRDDIRDITVHPQYRIVLIYRKNISDSCYHELVYKAKKVKWEQINMPKELAYLKY